MIKPLRVHVSDFNTNPRLGTTQYVDIDIFKFIRDKDVTDNIVVQVLEGENYVYLDEFEPKVSPIENIELLVIAQEWIINHVRIK